MKNSEVAQVLKNIADLLELKQESPFKVRAYQRAARAIETLPAELEVLRREDRLQEIAGVGEAIAEKITELLTTGRLQYYEKLRAEFPPGIMSLVEIPGVGPRTAMRLSQELGISSVAELEQAIREGKVASLHRFGEKTAENILRHIQSLRRKDRRIPIGQALPVVESILEGLRQIPGVRNLSPAGSLRRFRETVGDIDLMGTADNPEQVLRAFTRLPHAAEVLLQGATKASIVTHGGLQVDLRLVEHERFGSLLQYFTGSKDHNIALRERALRQGLSLSEYGVTEVQTEVTEKFAKEEDFYARLGLQWVPPELREHRGEIEKAVRGEIPQLLSVSDLKGDLHVHTDWSDGRASLEEMTRAARARGYQYIAITDHSAGRGIARGLSVDRIRSQVAEVRDLSRRLEDIELLTGIEVDIRADGTLDYPDAVLAELDLVVAAVHSGMGQDEDRMTRRVIKALENPNVHVLAHPTCRLLGEREPVNLNMEAVFRAAVRTRTALEINANPLRLDLNDRHIFRARELGVLLVMATDAHSPEMLDLMRFGVGAARRGWCEPHHILNSRPWAQVKAILRGVPV